ncbi:MAG: insulinase family protein [Bacteroidales bacterium]|nr:insulinase family protein [Bacteroidales bacterium]
MLPNGLKVFVVENHKIPQISYSIVLDYDPLLQNNHTGFVGIAGSMIGTSTTTRTKAQLDEELDFIGASLSATASGVSGSALTRHNDKLLELMADVVLHSTFWQKSLIR